MTKKKERLEGIKFSLNLTQVQSVLFELGGEPTLSGDTLVSKTICHGGDSHKLYYYDNTKLFKCYTHCPEESFDIFELILKVKKRQGEKIAYYSSEGQRTLRDWSLPDAVKFISLFFNIETEGSLETEEQGLTDWNYFSKWKEIESKKQSSPAVSLEPFDESLLKHYPQPTVLPWLREGISKEAMDYHNIHYDPVSASVLIPHYDKDGTLIGIRQRTLVEEEEKWGKYRPAKLSGKMYNHPLSFALYNLNRSKDNIRDIGKAIVFEGEKSTLLYSTFFGKENDISVAVCGSNLTSSQVKLLLELDVNEIIIAFDKQFKEAHFRDEEWVKWTEKLVRIHRKFGHYVQISYLFDKDGLLGYKDSPVDRGKETFIELFTNRVLL